MTCRCNQCGRDVYSSDLEGHRCNRLVTVDGIKTLCDGKLILRGGASYEEYRDMRQRSDDIEHDRTQRESWGRDVTNNDHFIL